MGGLRWQRCTMHSDSFEKKDLSARPQLRPFWVHFWPSQTRVNPYLKLFIDLDESGHLYSTDIGHSKLHTYTGIQHLSIQEILSNILYTHESNLSQRSKRSQLKLSSTNR